MKQNRILQNLLPPPKFSIGKCADCHTSQGALPFYADFPFVQDVIRADMAEALAAFNIERQIYQAGQETSEATLRDLEYVIHNGSMPPFRYLILHWDKMLGQEDRQALQDWIDEVRLQRREALRTDEGSKEPTIQASEQ